MHKKHIELIEAVNNAKTEREHANAEAVLVGYRIALDELYGGWSGTACDRHYMDQGITRPMCCGVFLDWKPSAVELCGQTFDVSPEDLAAAVARA